MGLSSSISWLISSIASSLESFTVLAVSDGHKPSRFEPKARAASRAV
jgi:hypothetical protein